MLEYRENINYMQSQGNSIDAQIEQLHQLCSKGITDYELYQHIRGYIYTEIKIKQLAVTLILNDLRQIRLYNYKAANIIEFYVINNDYSYADIADWFGCSKQYIHQVMTKYSQEYIWLYNLMRIKGDEDCKNENNRSIRFNQPRKTIQLSLWQED